MRKIREKIILKQEKSNENGLNRKIKKMKEKYKENEN